MSADEQLNSKTDITPKILFSLSGFFVGMGVWSAVSTAIAVFRKRATAGFWGDEHKISTGVVYSLISGVLAIITGKISENLDKKEEARKSDNATPILSSASTEQPVTVERGTGEVEVLAKTSHEGHMEKVKKPSSSYVEQAQAPKQVLEASK